MIIRRRRVWDSSEAKAWVSYRRRGHSTTLTHGLPILRPSSQTPIYYPRGLCHPHRFSRVVMVITPWNKALFPNTLPSCGLSYHSPNLRRAFRKLQRTCFRVLQAVRSRPEERGHLSAQPALLEECSPPLSPPLRTVPQQHDRVSDAEPQEPIKSPAHGERAGRLYFSLLLCPSPSLSLTFGPGHSLSVLRTPT